MANWVSAVRGNLFTHRFLYLFIVLLIPYMFHPLMDSDFIGISILDVSFSLVLAVSMLALSARQHSPWPIVAVALTALAITWACNWVPGPQIRLVAVSMIALMMAYTAGYLLNHIVRRKDVTANTIFAALCVYLLIGYIWAFMYSIQETLSPGSFNFNGTLFDIRADKQHVFWQLYYFMYYSFTSLTTLGLGDIVPATPSARVLTALEAMIGQIYLVVLVSRLVGMHITQTATNSKK